MKKMSYAWVGFVLLAFLISFTMNTPLLAQEKEEEVEDVMDMALEDLLNVEITTAGKQAEKISEVPASVVVVTRDDIEKYGYQNLAEILENIPGLYQTDDQFSKNFGVRGFWTFDPNRNMTFLVNGVEQTEYVVSGNWLQLMNIPVEAIDRIEVVRGPMSVIYGSGAFFGAINIFTNKVGDKPVSMVSTSFGSEKTSKVFARASGKQGDFQYAFNGSYFNTDGIDVPYAGMTQYPEFLPGLGVPENQTTAGQLENKEKYFNFSGTFKDFSFDASYTESHKETNVVLPSVSDGTMVFNKAMRLSFGYKKEFSEKLTLDLRFGYFMTKRLQSFDWLVDDVYLLQNDESSGYKAELNLFWNPSSKLNVSFGLSYNKVIEIQNELNYPLFAFILFHNELAEGESVVTQAIFTQLSYKLSDKFKVVAGLRLEQNPEYTAQWRIGDPTPDLGTFATYPGTYSRTDVDFIPRLALIYSPNDKNVFKFLYGKAINRPSFFQLTEDIIGRGMLPLVPETIQTIELNYVGSLSPKFSVSLSVFRNMMDKLIFRSFFVLDGALVSYYQNVGEMTTNGVELTLTAKPSKSFFLELSGTYQDTTDKRYEDVDVGYSPKFLGYLKASYFFSKDISLAINGNYVSDMEAYYDDTFDPPARIGEKVDSYFLLGANLRIRNLFGKGVFLNLRASNLLDEEIHYPTTTYSSSYADLGTIGRGMTFLATLGWKFK